jgi:hypothetical protein
MPDVTSALLSVVQWQHSRQQLFAIGAPRVAVLASGLQQACSL